MGRTWFLGALGVCLNPGRRPSASESASLPEALRAIAERLDRPSYLLRSWRMVQRSLRQIDPFEMIVTDRFHGHILSAIRRIPHVVIGNNHHKIEGHWDQWMRALPGAALARTPEELATALADPALFETKARGS
jgi:exopolysaccharide biosynthesis predicted pyruvyltransferase EpsI